MLTLGKAKEAADVFDRILEKYGKDPAFLAPPEGAERHPADQAEAGVGAPRARATSPRPRR